MFGSISIFVRTGNDSEISANVSCMPFLAGPRFIFFEASLFFDNFSRYPYLEDNLLLGIGSLEIFAE